MSIDATSERSSVEARLKRMLAETSPLPPEEIDRSVQLVELGLSSLQLQILAAEIETAFQITFLDAELGEIDNVGQLVDCVVGHRMRKVA